MLRRVFGQCWLALHQQETRSTFEAVGQYGVCVPGGAEKVALATKLGHESGATVLGFDVINAFNTAYRRETVRGLLAMGPLGVQLLRYYDFVYGTPSSLLFRLDTGAIETVVSQRGSQQGCPFGGFFFAAAIYSPMKSFNTCPDNLIAGRLITGYADDLQCQSPQLCAPTADACEVFTGALAANGLAVHKGVANKGGVLLPPGFVLADSPGVAALIEERGYWLNPEGMPVVGVPIGSDAYIRQFVTESVARIKFDVLAEQVASMGGSHAQVAFQLLRKCLATKTGFLCRCIDPEVIRGIVPRLDSVVIWCLESLLELPGIATMEAILQSDTPMDLLVTSESQQLQLRLPVSKGGLGLSFMQTGGAAAYLGMVVDNIPAIARVLLPVVTHSLEETVRNDARRDRLEHCTTFTSSVTKAIRSLQQAGVDAMDLARCVPLAWVAQAVRVEAVNEVGAVEVCHWLDPDVVWRTVRGEQLKLCDMGFGSAHSQRNLSRLLIVQLKRRFVVGLEALPEELVANAAPLLLAGQLSGETRKQAQARVRSVSHPAANLWIDASAAGPTAMPPQAFRMAVSRTLGIEIMVQDEGVRCHTQNCPCARVDTRHARLCCDRQGTRVHTKVLDTIASGVRSLGGKVKVETAQGFLNNSTDPKKKRRIDFLISAASLHRGGEGYKKGRKVLGDANLESLEAKDRLFTDSEKGILCDVTIAEPQAVTHLRGPTGSALRDGSSLLPAERRKRQHHLGLFDSNCYTLRTIGFESFGRFNQETESVLALAVAHATASAKGCFGPRLRHFLQRIAVSLQKAVSFRVINFVDGLSPEPFATFPVFDIMPGL
jgi:hypothetical protein